MLAVLYGRVSTEEQHRSGFSLSEQMKACRQRAQALAEADREPLSIAEFTDDVSGELLERPGLQAALDLVRNGSAALFICLDPDRLARRLMHQLLVTDEIECHHCRLEFVQHDYQETPEGRLFYQMRGAIAEFEKAKILERTSRGRRGKIAAGGLPHVIRMYGYRFLKGAPKQAQAREVLVPHPQEAGWVRQLFRWCASEQLGPLSIARRLNQLGVPTKLGKAHWHHTQVRRILTHPTYVTGLLALGKGDHRGIGVARRLTKRQREEKGLVLTARPHPVSQWQYVEVEPLVDAQLWEQAQQVLEGFRVGRRRSGGREALRPLSGLGRCGLCGGSLYYANGGKMVCSRRYAAHWGGRPPDGEACRLPAKPKAAVEAAVWEQVGRWLTDPVLLADATGRLREMVISPEAAQNDTAAEAAMLEAELRQRQDEAERVGLLFTRGLWPADRALLALEAINRQIAALTERLDLLKHPRHQPSARLPQALAARLSQSELIAAVRETLDTLPPDKRATLIRLAVGSFDLLPSGRGAPPRVEAHPAL